MVVFCNGRLFSPAQSAACSRMELCAVITVAKTARVRSISLSLSASEPLYQTVAVAL
jgi:hypothetical protein